MALIGTTLKEIKGKSFNPDTNTWSTDFDLAIENGYASQGFDFPQHTPDNPPDWINKPTGYSYITGLVMAFPRSAEKSTPPPPPSSNGWQVKEA